MKPDEEKWKQFFGVDNTWDYNVYETESRIGDKIEFQTYTDKQENTLYLTSEEALWAKQDMVFIYYQIIRRIYLRNTQKEPLF